MTDLTILLLVVGVAVTTTSMLLLARTSTPSDDRTDVALDSALPTDAATRWSVDATPRPVRELLRSADRRVAGGSMVAGALVALFVTAALLGWIFSGIDDQRGWARWDASAAEFGRDNATEASTRVLVTLTDLGASVALFVVMALIGVYHSVRRSDTGPLAYLIVVGVGVALLNNGLKLVIDRDRPDLAQLAGSAGSAFPSGHTAAAAACWAAIALVLTSRRSVPVKRFAAAGAIVLALVVAATRVLLGVHWLSDVIAGLVVGWGWWLLVTIMFGGRTLRLGSGAVRAVDQEHPAEASLADERRSPSLEGTGRP